MKFNIAIDGPSAAGKSTIAKLLAKKYNFSYLDTGAMYRLVAYKAIKNNIDLTDEKALAEMIKESYFDIFPDGSIYLDKKPIDDRLIRSAEISMISSNISKFNLVRNALVLKQRKICEGKGYVVDGRDIGSVVLKDAEVKIYLTAGQHDRAIRRYKQNKEKGILNQSLEMIEKDIENRDFQDMNRKHSPLIRASDAVLVDSSKININETVDFISNIIEEKINVKK